MHYLFDYQTVCLANCLLHFWIAKAHRERKKFICMVQIVCTNKTEMNKKKSIERLQWYIIYELNERNAHNKIPHLPKMITFWIIS